MLSVIVPTLNEEKYLPRTLASIFTPDFKGEVIVADARSRDRTVEIARQYNCKLVGGGIQAKGRNEGAKIAAGDILFFSDADVQLPAGFLPAALEEFNRRGLAIATCSADPISSHWADRLVYSLANLAVVLAQRTRPLAQGFCIFIKKSLHDEIGGFDESITFAEDSEYAARAARQGKFGVLKSRILVSSRRFEKEGHLKLSLKYLYLNLRRLLFGEIRRPINYSYGKFSS